MRTRYGVLILGVFALLAGLVFWFDRTQPAPQPISPSPTPASTATPDPTTVPRREPSPTPLMEPSTNTPIITQDRAMYALTDEGLLRRIPDTRTLRGLGYKPEQLPVYSDEALAPYPLAPDLTRWLDDEHAVLFFLDQGKRRTVPDLETALAMEA
ncbi:MAG TPA: hypothetical protein G4N94_13135, partial [Caldilineae bacterium]|nr:hypothetical protein [Caldilineae bacterium]